MTPDGEIWTTVTERENGVWAGMSGSQNTIATTWYGIIDLSDTTNFPHEHTGALHFSVNRIHIDKSASARGSLSFGIVTTINATSSSITQIGGIGFTEKDVTVVESIINFAPMQMKANVVAGALPYIKGNTTLTGITAVNTSITLPPFNFTPGVGDLVLMVNTTATANLNFGVGFGYHSHPA